jgi:HK97 family phage portal protein
MSWLSNLFKKNAPKDVKFAPTTSGWTPIYSQMGMDVYAFDAVQQCLKCIVDELKKLNPMHIRQKGNDPVPVPGNIQDILDCPNDVMTTTEMIEKTIWMLLLNFNAFIIPTYVEWVDKQTGETRRRYTGLYPINPSQVDFIEDASGALYVQFWFLNGKKTVYPYSDVIHLKYNYSVNEYMGGNEAGVPDHRGLMQTLELNRRLLDGVAKAMNSSYQVNGVIKYNTMMDETKMKAAIQELERHLQRGESGFLPIDLKMEYIPIQKQIEMVDNATLEFIDSKILRNWGVPLDILRGNYSQDVYNSFYQKCLEPIIVSFSQALTKKIFTRREISFGNKIKLYPKELLFMTTAQTIDMIKELSPTGALFENEKRAALGMMPLPELEGKRYMSLNWIDANNAAQYQVGVPQGTEPEEGDPNAE